MCVCHRQWGPTQHILYWHSLPLSLTSAPGEPTLNKGPANKHDLRSALGESQIVTMWTLPHLLSRLLMLNATDFFFFLHFSQWSLPPTQNSRNLEKMSFKDYLPSFRKFLLWGLHYSHGIRSKHWQNSMERRKKWRKEGRVRTSLSLSQSWESTPFLRNHFLWLCFRNNRILRC